MTRLTLYGHREIANLCARLYIARDKPINLTLRRIKCGWFRFAPEHDAWTYTPRSTKRPQLLPISTELTRSLYFLPIGASDHLDAFMAGTRSKTALTPSQATLDATATPTPTKGRGRPPRPAVEPYNPFWMID